MYFKDIPKATELGPTGEPKCPSCKLSFGHGRIYKEEDLYCCGNCKEIFSYSDKSDQEEYVSWE